MGCMWLLFLGINQHTAYMEKHNKEMYDAPWTQVMEFITEGVIATSGPQPTYNNPFGDQDNW